MVYILKVSFVVVGKVWKTPLADLTGGQFVPIWVVKKKTEKNIYSFSVSLLI